MGEGIPKRRNKKTYSLREAILALEPPRILLAEDDDDLRHLVAATLRREGYSVIELADGASLLEHVGSMDLFDELISPVDVIISDVAMPGFSGLQVLADLRDANLTTPVILMTAFLDDRVKATAERLGAEIVFHKPFALEDLCDVVHAVASPASVPLAGRI